MADLPYESTKYEQIESKIPLAVANESVKKVGTDIQSFNVQ